MLKIFQVSLKQYMNSELPDIQARFRKGKGTRDQLANIHWIIEKAKTKQTNKTTSAQFTTVKPLATNCGKFFKRCEYQTT